MQNYSATARYHTFENTLINNIFYYIALCINYL